MARQQSRESETIHRKIVRWIVSLSRQEDNRSCHDCVSRERGKLRLNKELRQKRPIHPWDDLLPPLEHARLGQGIFAGSFRGSRIGLRLGVKFTLNDCEALAHVFLRCDQQQTAQMKGGSEQVAGLLVLVGAVSMILRVGSGQAFQEGASSACWRFCSSIRTTLICPFSMNARWEPSGLTASVCSRMDTGSRGE